MYASTKLKTALKRSSNDVGKTENNFNSISNVKAADFGNNAAHIFSIVPGDLNKSQKHEFSRAKGTLTVGKFSEASNNSPRITSNDEENPRDALNLKFSHSNDQKKSNLRNSR